VIYAATREEVATRRIGLRPRIAQVERDAIVRDRRMAELVERFLNRT
jgi:hypothetical protein